MKVRPAGVELLHAVGRSVGRTDRQTWPNTVPFRNLSTAPYKLQFEFKCIMTQFFVGASSTEHLVSLLLVNPLCELRKLARNLASVFSST
jgi:hypothetical protein